MADIESLLAPTAQESPCGPNLEYEQPFLSLMALAQGKPEKQIGDVVVPAEMPDWGAVSQQAQALLVHTKDLRVAILLVRAMTRTEHLPGLLRGLKLVHGLLERYWDGLHPVPNPDDPEDIVIRFNALALLVDPQAVLLDVRCALVVASGPHGRVSVRDALIGIGKILPAKGETVMSYQQIENAIADAAAKDPVQVRAASECVDMVGAVSAFLSSRSGAYPGLDLNPLLGLLKPVAQLCNSVMAQFAAPPQAEAAAQDGPRPPENANAATPAFSVTTPQQIRSRDDAMRMLDAVCSYYENAEPGNPAPLLIRRAQRLMNKSFVEIMQDLAPDSLDQIRRIAGLKSEES